MEEKEAQKAEAKRKKREEDMKERERIMREQNEEKRKYEEECKRKEQLDKKGLKRNDSADDQGGNVGHHKQQSKGRLPPIDEDNAGESNLNNAKKPPAIKMPLSNKANYFDQVRKQFPTEESRGESSLPGSQAPSAFRVHIDKDTSRPTTQFNTGQFSPPKDHDGGRGGQ